MIEKDKSNPLVSIIVITYNSSKYVLETLESAKNQTYKNIELIISDDGSQDETIVLCRNWISKNKEEFVRTELISVPSNTGIPANCNRGIKSAHGEWVKLIAGDDILSEECIALNVEYVRKKGFPDIMVISNMVSFKDGDKFYKEGKLLIPEILWIFEDGISSSIQYQYAIKYYLGNTPTLFIAKRILTDISFDEKYPFMEDRPFAINATKKGYTFHYLNATTVYYRISENSVFASKGSEVLFNDFYLKRRAFVLEYIYPNISFMERWVTNIEFYRKRTIHLLGLNRNNSICRLINFISFRMTPYYLFRKFQLKIESKRNTGSGNTNN